MNSSPITIFFSIDTTINNNKINHLVQNVNIKLLRFALKVELFVLTHEYCAPDGAYTGAFHTY